MHTSIGSLNRHSTRSRELQRSRYSAHGYTCSAATRHGQLPTSAFHLAGFTSAGRISLTNSMRTSLPRLIAYSNIIREILPTPSAITRLNPGPQE
jgi:hypothetical protein